ncbi:hypothetical protein GC197_13220 [bacterium]|nr:hypothetical protein [bacterium]
MSTNYAILREADCRLDRNKAAKLMAPLLGLSYAEMLQDLHDRPGILARNVPHDAAREAAKTLIVAGMPCRVVHEDHLIEVPVPPKTTVREMEFYEEHLVFRSTGWEGHVPWKSIRLLDIIQESTTKTELVPSAPDECSADPRPTAATLRRRKFELGIFLEIVCTEPVMRMRIDRSLFGYKTTGLKMHTSRELNFRALCIAMHMRSEDALTGPGFAWISKGNNSHHNNGNSRKKFENLATWLLTLEA